MWDENLTTIFHNNSPGSLAVGALLILWAFLQDVFSRLKEQEFTLSDSD